MVGDLKGIRVHLGTDRLGMELSINLIKVGFLGRYLLGVKLPLHLRVPLLAATQLLLHRLLQRGKSSLPGRLPVQAHPGAALGHHQTVPLQTPGGSGHITVQILFHLVQQALQFCCFHTSGFHRPLFAQKSGGVLPSLGQKVISAVCIGRLRRGGPVIVHLGGGDGAPPLPVGDSPGNLISMLRHGLIQRLPSLLHGHAGHIQTGDGRVGKDPVHRSHPGAQPQICHQQRTQNYACHDKPRFLFSILRRLHHALAFHAIPPRKPLL